MPKTFDNVIRNEDLKTRLGDVFADLRDILISHSGPFAASCVIGSRWRQANDVDEFTKDGIKILKHLVVSEDPVHRFATRMARFVGITVDSRCHDGTTTSMMMFCILALISIQEMGEGGDRTRYTYSHTIHRLLNDCLDYLATLRITEDDIYEECTKAGIETSLDEVRAALAYHMAMISSKGDHDLSSKISTVIKTTPKKIFGMFRDTNLAIETKDPYVIKKQPFDIAFGGNLGDMRLYNYKNDTQYLSEDAVIFATANDIVTNSWEANFLTSFIGTHASLRADLLSFGVEEGWDVLCQKKRNLIIVAPMINDPRLITEIELFNHTHPECKIAWFFQQVHPRLRTSMDKTLHYVAGVRQFVDCKHTNALDSLIGFKGRPARVAMIGSTIAISNLYEKTGETYHPYYTDPSLHEDYTRFRTETEELIEFAQSQVANPSLDANELTDLITLYRALICQEIYDIEVGGSSHDQYANKTVYEDAIGAALSAVSDGVVLSGYAHLVKFLNGVHANDPMMTELREDFRAGILQLLQYSMKEDSSERSVIQSLIDNDLANKWWYVAANPHHYDPSRSDPREYIFAETLKYDLVNFLKCEPGRPFLLQAYAGYEEQFKRFIDILPRLANTTHLCDMRVDDANVR